MLRRHFITGENTSKPYFIITYYAPKHVPFFGGIIDKNIKCQANPINMFPENLIFDIVLDEWKDGIGSWGIKLINSDEQICYFGPYYYQDTDVAYIGDVMYLVDFKPGQETTLVDNRDIITDIIIPEGIVYVNGNIIFTNIDRTLQNVTFPNSLKYISNYPLLGLTQLKTITIPENVICIKNAVTQINDTDSGNGHRILENVIIKPVNPPEVLGDKFSTPFGNLDNFRDINPNLKFRVYADCIDTYKNDSVWGQYFDLYDTINNVIVYHNNYKHYLNFKNTIHNYYDDINRGVYSFNNEEVIELNNEFFNVDDIYITQECNIVINKLNLLPRPLKNVYIKTSKYDSRENCNCIVETNTNYLVLAGKNMNIPQTVIGIYNEAIAITEFTLVVEIPYNIKYINANAFNRSNFRVLSINANDDLIIYSADYNAICNIYLFGCMIREHINISESNYYYPSYYNYEYTNCGIVRKGDNTLIKAGCEDSIGPHVTNIQGAFAYNTELMRIIIPDNVLRIEGAFLGCDSLEYVTMSNNITHIGNYTFMDCKKLHIDNIITDNTKSIGIDAFAGCNFDSFDTKNIESIDNMSTNYLITYNLIIRKSLKEFKGSVYMYTQRIIVDSDNEYFKNENGCLIRKDDNALILVVANTNTIIEGIEKLCSYSCSFANTELHIPNTIKIIEHNTFRNNYFHIHYNGTLSEWESIEKENYWHNYRITIYCIDGDITID